VQPTMVIGADRQTAMRPRFRRKRRSATTTPSNGRGLTLQIPPSPLRAHFVRAIVQLHE
jgi:hypothetical protein